MAVPDHSGEFIEPPRFGPAITSEQMYNGERSAHAWGATRRTAHALLTRSSDDLLGTCADPDLLLDLQRYLEWRDAETELLKTARARLLSVLLATSDSIQDDRLDEEDRAVFSRALRESARDAAEDSAFLTFLARSGIQKYRRDDDRSNER
jgi:hypothetical protein